VLIEALAPALAITRLPGGGVSKNDYWDGRYARTSQPALITALGAILDARLGAELPQSVILV
jgi:hypothetical protein